MKFNKAKVNTVLDILLFIVLLGIYFVKGGMHETLGYTLGALMVLHVALHWKQFKAMYRHLIPKPGYQKLVAGLVGILVVAVIVGSSYLPNDREGGPSLDGRSDHVQNEQWQQDRDID
ncbi:MAG: hypothetical protein ACM3PP_04960 [Candidatus Saccharibacteria bacterium]